MQYWPMQDFMAFDSNSKFKSLSLTLVEGQSRQIALRTLKFSYWNRSCTAPVPIDWGSSTLRRFEGKLLVHVPAHVYLTRREKRMLPFNSHVKWIRDFTLSSHFVPFFTKTLHPSPGKAATLWIDDSFFPFIVASSILRSKDKHEAPPSQ